MVEITDNRPLRWVIHSQFCTKSYKWEGCCVCLWLMPAHRYDTGSLHSDRPVQRPREAWPLRWMSTFMTAIWPSGRVLFSVSAIAIKLLNTALNERIHTRHFSVATWHQWMLTDVKSYWNLGMFVSMFTSVREQLRRFLPNLACLFPETRKKTQRCQNSEILPDVPVAREASTI
jgi:hypothetical protein